MKTLLTGATGYIGKKLAQGLLADPANTLIISLRSKDGADFDAKKAQFLAAMPAGSADRVRIVNSDLANLPAQLDPCEIEGIIHCAAATAFNISEDLAEHTNIAPSLKLLEFARTTRALKKFLYVSTVYASGLTEGEVHERFFDPAPGFANHYERSKWTVEDHIRRSYLDLPIAIARVATVLSDDESGRIVQQNAIHNTLKLFYYGLLSLMPGHPTTPIYLVDGEFVRRSLLAIYNAPTRSGDIFHVCHEEANALTLAQLVDVAFEVFQSDTDFKTRRIMKPLMADEKSFSTLVAGMKSFGGAVLNQGLSSVAPFGKQLFIHKRFSNANLRRLRADYQAPDARRIAVAAIDNLVQTQFKKRGS